MHIFLSENQVHSPHPKTNMASRIATAAKGVRFASHSTVNASNPWLAERIAVKEHAGRKFSLPFLMRLAYLMLLPWTFDLISTRVKGS